MSATAPQEEWHDWRPAPLLPRGDGRDRSLVFVVAVLCFLSCLTVFAAVAGDRAAQGWSRDLAASATVQVRPSGGQTPSEAAARAAEALAGVPGVTERIRVRSIVGRFLEHARVFCFGNDGEAEVFCSSADWMERNFFRRVEVAFPILDPLLRASLVEDLQLYLEDDRQAWQLDRDGVYARVEPRAEGGLSAQQALMDRYAASALTP